MNIKTAIVLILLCLPVAACKKECRIKSGAFTTRSEQTQPFTKIFVDGRMDLRLHQDSSHTVVISGSAVQLDGVSVEVTNGGLYIKNNNGCRVFRGYQGDDITVSVGFATLEKLRMTLPGKLWCTDTLRGEHLVLEVFDCSGSADLVVSYNKVEAVNIKGAADIKICGRAHVAYLRNEDKGFIYAEGLRAHFVKAEQEGLGDMYMYGDEHMEIHLRGGGDVIYSGSAIPKITYGPTAIGKVRKGG
jgi:hypothetical protein